MSIYDQINEAVRARKLVFVRPSLGGFPVKRYLFVEYGMMERINGALAGNTEDDARLGGLVDDFNEFISDRELTVGDDPCEKDISVYMARTCPVQDAVFDIRSRDPDPGVRVFGCFAERDTFVGLTWKYRRDLGGRSDRRFDQAVLEARGVWDRMFPDHKPLYSEDIHDHLTNIRVL